MNRLAQELGGQSMHRCLRFTVHCTRILRFVLDSLSRAVAGQVAPVAHGKNSLQHRGSRDQTKHIILSTKDQATK